MKIDFEDLKHGDLIVWGWARYPDSLTGPALITGSHRGHNGLSIFANVEDDDEMHTLWGDDDYEDTRTIYKLPSPPLNGVYLKTHPFPAQGGTTAGLIVLTQRKHPVRPYVVHTCNLANDGFHTSEYFVTLFGAEVVYQERAHVVSV